MERRAPAVAASMHVMTEDRELGVVGPSLVPIPDHDPLATLLVSRSEPVSLTGLALESPALEALRAAGVVLVVPLVVDEELLGTINLGSRRSEQEYSTDDRSLLATLASQLAPAIRLAGLARRQEEEAARRERIDQELRVAGVIQQTLLPRDLPDLPGWELRAFYRPAREVGGDFYDVVSLDDGKVVVLEGDVTDKGVPAALVMATCRSALRSATERSDDPAEILRMTNDALVDDIPETMFVTCFCGVIDDDKIRFANAGHPLPLLLDGTAVTAIRATGMPLGMLPNSTYEVVEVPVPMGGALVITSDGVAEAHGADGSMYGFDRVARVVAEADDPLSAMVDDVDRFAPIQEDDITIVLLRRRASAAAAATTFGSTLLELRLSSKPGVEREAMEQVVRVATDAGMAESRARKLGTAVAEAIMNAAEHGNRFDPELEVEVVVDDVGDALRVNVGDQGSVAVPDVEVPDLGAKIAGDQSPRGWGRFLIGQLVDHVEDRRAEGRHVLTITMGKEEA